MDIFNLIATSDFFVLLLYTFLCYLLLRFVFFNGMERKFNRLLTVFFLFKVFCAVLMSLLLVYYWQTSDNVSFFLEGNNIIKLIKKDPSNIKYLFQPVEFYNDRIQYDYELRGTPSSKGIESNFMMAKITALLYPLAWGRYLLVNFLFSFIATIGQFKFFLALSSRYPKIKKGIAIAVLFMPSVLIYSSYMNKETLCMAFMGFAVYSYYRIQNKKHVVLNGFLLFLNIWLIAILKPYILVCFFGAVVFAYFIKIGIRFFKRSVFAKLFTIVMLTLLSLLFFQNLDYFDQYIIDFATKSNTFQEQYNAAEETSAFEFGEIETSFSGLLKKAPLGVYSTYFRPQLWEVNKPIILFSALESFVTLLLLLSALISQRKRLRQFFREDFFVSVSFFYVLFFGMIVGLTTFNFGTLVRYKIPAVPFLMLFIFLLFNFKPQKTTLEKAI